MEKLFQKMHPGLSMEWKAIYKDWLKRLIEYVEPPTVIGFINDTYIKISIKMGHENYEAKLEGIHILMVLSSICLKVSNGMNSCVTVLTRKNLLN